MAKLLVKGFAFGVLPFIHGTSPRFGGGRGGPGGIRERLKCGFPNCRGETLIFSGGRKHPTEKGRKDVWVAFIETKRGSRWALWDGMSWLRGIELERE
jgi:hypothetical protein